MLRHFSRITSSGQNFVPQIDGLRFIAILSVLAFHVREIGLFWFGLNDSPQKTSDAVSRTFGAGAIGVQLFFAISGFVLALPFARNHLFSEPAPRLRSYFLRRITRLEPPYFVHLIFLFALSALVLRHRPSHSVFYDNAHWVSSIASHLLPSLFYSNGFIHQAHPYPNIVLWSLEVEVQFYILAPFLAMLFKVRGTACRRILILCLTLVPAWMAQMWTGVYLVPFSLAGNLQYFLTGFLLCDFYLMNWKAATERHYRWDIAAFFALVAAVPLYYRPSVGFVFPAVIFVVGAAAFKGAAASRLLSNPWITTIGGMCYTIYMYHWLMTAALMRLTAQCRTGIVGLDIIIQLLIIGPIIIFSCSLLFIVFERPFMRKDWPVKLWNTIRFGRKPVPQPIPVVLD